MGPHARFMTLGMDAFVVFAMLMGLALLMIANQFSPGCTGPAVQRCDYIETAKAANSGPQANAFEASLGFNVFDRGSSVVVQQNYPVGGLVHGASVLIDKRSCRPCQVEYYGYLPPPLDHRDVPRGRLIQSTGPEDIEGAAELRRKLEQAGIPYQLDN